MQIRPAQPDDHDALLGIWLRSVRATHRFLTEADIQSLLPRVRDGALMELEIWVLTADDKPIGFLGMSGRKMEALFLAPEFLRRGGGRLLVEHAASQHPTLLVDVNEQNPEARRFYEALGFVVEGRSELDGQAARSHCCTCGGASDNPRGPRRRYTSLAVERRACAAAATQRPHVIARILGRPNGRAVGCAPP